MSAEPPSAETLLRRGPSVIAGELPEETILLRTDTGESVRLNATAAWLWSQTEAPLTLDDLSRRLRERYELPLDQALADASGFARSLGDRGFLTLEASGAA